MTRRSLSAVVACLKRVPLRVTVDPLTGETTADEQHFGMSAADQAALEWALVASEVFGVTAVAISIGPPEASALLTDALGRGVDHAMHIITESELSSAVTGETLARSVPEGSFVVCGDYSADRGTGSVPAFLAHQLNVPSALGCLSISPDPSGSARVQRRLDQGRREDLQLNGPAVVSVEQGPELRRASLRSMLNAERSSIEQHSVGHVLGREPEPLHEPVSTAPYVPRPRVLSSPPGETRSRIRELAGLSAPPKAAQRVKTDPEAAAELAEETLRTWGYLK